MLSASAIGGDALSVFATARGVVASIFTAEADGEGAFDRTRAVTWGVLLRSTHMVPTIATIAAAPTPLQM
jgi:hypothetical protein